MRFLRLSLVLLAAGGLGAEPARDRFDDPLPKGAIARLGSSSLRSEFMVSKVAFSPDGKILAAAGAGGIAFWDPITGKEVRRLPVKPFGQLCSFRFGPDGKALILGGDAIGIRVVDAATGAEQRKLDMPERGLVLAADVSRDGKTAAALRLSETSSIWDLASGKLVRAFKGLTGSYAVGEWIALTPEGKQLVLPHADGSLHLLSVASGKEVLAFEAPPARPRSPQGSFRRVAISPDGRYLACAGLFHPAALCDLKTGKRVGPPLLPLHAITGLAFAPDSRTLAISTYQDIRFFNVPSGKEKRKLATASGSDNALAFSPDGRMLASLGTGYVLELWDVAAGRRLHPPPTGHVAPVRSLAFFADGKRLASAAAIGADLAVWDIAAGRTLAHSRSVYAYPNTLRVVEDGATLQFLASDGAIHRWKPSDGRDEQQKIPPHPNTVPTVLAPDGREVASITHGATLQVTLQDPKKDKATRSLELPAGVYLNPLLFSPDGRRLAACCSDGALRLWDRATGALVKKIDTGRPALLAFAGDGRSLAVWGSAVRLIETATGKERLKLQQSAPMSALACSPTGHLLACGYSDGRILVHDTATKKEVANWHGRQGVIEGLAFSRDGRLLASGGANGLILVWRLPDAEDAPVALKAEQAAELWQTLLSPSADAANRALAGLAAAPAQAIPLIKERFRDMGKRLDSQQLARLIAELDDDSFKVRQRAMRALAEAGADAAGLLRKALADNPSPEKKRRIEELLDHLNKGGGAESLRELRAIEVLERIGTKEARDALRELSRKAVSTELREEIEASLRRLDERLRTTSEK
ncbi:MAG TPA: WD40 repeat domain-containing protein [Gemmataceae bacterium]|jgi:WD40 repeat protein